MGNPQTVQSRISARDGAHLLINQVTAGVAMCAFGALGVFAAVSATTVPGTTASATASTSSVTSSSSTSSSRNSSSSGLQSSSGSVSSSSGTGIVVSGGSH